jgi:predicted Zn-dependent peptidase
VTPPTFDAANAYAFNDRELPTAYIRIKLNAPSVTDKDAVATRFLYEILSEELGEEIRTKRSLSYAVHSYVLQYSMGLGVISASTSKPKETLEAIHDVLAKMKSKTFTPEELEEYKHGFATSYYLTQETHASLTAALSSALQFYGGTDELYEMPRRLGEVTPADIKRLAGELLVDLRVGVIFGRKDFQDSWAKDLIEKNRKVAAKKS